jgi:hypothetical protein
MLQQTPYVHWAIRYGVRIMPEHVALYEKARALLSIARSLPIPSNVSVVNKNIPTLARRCIRRSVGPPIRKTSWRWIPMLKNRHHLSDTDRPRYDYEKGRGDPGTPGAVMYKIGEDADG